ncbi:extracellular solute-binding protein [Kribbella sp. NPDC004875]|uniref:extracellular solute-binding protein n=1 Tax=Kribbella sp. NPDC004875 TaxID=3364107 RepID=UPI0036A1155E
MTVLLRGLTWDHPRGYRPLQEFSHPDVEVEWDRQPLSGFESTPLEELAGRYDLLVIDHPGLGAAIEAGALLPVEDVFSADDLATWRARAVPPTWESYQLEGHGWALPLDAATQTCIYRPDRLATPPASWSDVLELPGVVLCVAGPHAGLMLLGMAGDRTGTRLLDRERAVAALEVLRAVWSSSEQSFAELDPIGIHELLGTGELKCCPLVYSYAYYGRPADDRAALAWSAAPRLLARDSVGNGTLGGTGLAVTPRAYSKVLAVTKYTRGLLDVRTQLELVSAVGGQSATTAVWESPAVDDAWNGHYSATLGTVRASYVRPRFDGWIGFQDELSERVRELLDDDEDPAAAVDRIEDDYRKVRDG